MRRREFAALTGAGFAALASAGIGRAEGESAGSLRAGCGKVDITPGSPVWLSGWASRNKPSEGIEDRLYARALVLDSGGTRVAILALDLIGVPAELVAKVRKQVASSCGIPEAHLMISASHTHFAPAVREYEFDKGGNPQYVSSLAGMLAQAVENAAAALAPAKLGADSGILPEPVYNRRPLDSGGQAVMIWRLPPSQGGLEFGPVDPEVGVIRVEDPEGGLLGSLVNYACHPVAGDNYEPWFYHISADYPGVSSGVVEGAEGGVSLFTLGTSGNINPCERGRLCRGHVGRALGGEALRVLQRVRTSGDITLAAASKKITLPLKDKPDPNANHKPPAGQTSIETEVQAIRLGDCMLVGMPGEVLVELGLDLKRRAGVERLFAVSLANDTIGYICHRESYGQGGYEPLQGSQLAPGGGELVVEAALEVVEQVKKA
jgi:hypothetical protein